jgi:phosphoglycerate dehydrogenase-like enzyme
MSTLIVSGDSLADGVEEGLVAAGHSVVRGPSPTPPALEPVLPRERWAEAADADIIVVSPRDSAPSAVLEAAPNLRAIVSLVIGVETIDIAAAHARGLLVAHGAMEENYLGVSEAAIMLITALFLELSAKERWLREGTRSHRIPGRMLRGSTVGLIGMGRSARGVVERLRGWEVRILSYDPYIDSASAPPEVTMVSFDELLARSDVVSIHATLDPASRHLVSDPELAAMKPSAFLVNVARGGLVDEVALVRALQTEQIRGAALDVFETEPLPSDSPLRTMENVILTPHCAGHSRELMEAVPRTALENIQSILDGERPPYVKSPPAVLERWLHRHGTAGGD